MPAATADAFVTVTELATQIRRDVATVRRWCSQDLIPGAVKHGRDWNIPKAAAERVVKEGVSILQAG